MSHWKTQHAESKQTDSHIIIRLQSWDTLTTHVLRILEIGCNGVFPSSNI